LRSGNGMGAGGSWMFRPPPAENYDEEVARISEIMRTQHNSGNDDDSIGTTRNLTSSDDWQFSDLGMSEKMKKITLFQNRTATPVGIDETHSLKKPDTLPNPSEVHSNLGFNASANLTSNFGVSSSFSNTEAVRAQSSLSLDHPHKLDNYVSLPRFSSQNSSPQKRSRSVLVAHQSSPPQASELADVKFLLRYNLSDSSASEGAGGKSLRLPSVVRTYSPTPFTPSDNTPYHLFMDNKYAKLKSAKQDDEEQRLVDYLNSMKGETQKGLNKTQKAAAAKLVKALDTLNPVKEKSGIRKIG